MPASFRIVRGIKQNRVKRVKWREGKYDRSPQRAKLRRNQAAPGASWTAISVCLPVDALIAIDARADEMNMSRSAYLVWRALATVSDIRDEASKERG